MPGEPILIPGGSPEPQQCADGGRFFRGAVAQSGADDATARCCEMGGRFEEVNWLVVWNMNFIFPNQIGDDDLP